MKITIAFTLLMLLAVLVGSAIAYTCTTADQKVEYEALHFVCPHRGPRNVAAAVYDVEQQTFLTDREDAGNYRSVIRLDEIAQPACDLPL